VRIAHAIIDADSALMISLRNFPDQQRTLVLEHALQPGLSAARRSSLNKIQS
jgi:hypothetical protein